MNISVKKVNSLGLLKLPKDTKVVVAMSGGVDSSTVAGLITKFYIFKKDLRKTLLNHLLIVMLLEKRQYHVCSVIKL